MTPGNRSMVNESPHPASPGWGRDHEPHPANSGADHHPKGWCAKGTVRPAMSLRHAARGFELLGRRFATCRPDWVARDHYLALCPSRLGSLCRFSPAQNSVDSVRRGSTLLNCTGPVARGIICQVMGAVICWSLPPCNRADGEWGVTAPAPAIIGADYAEHADVATGRWAAEQQDREVEDVVVIAGP